MQNAAAFLLAPARPGAMPDMRPGETELQDAPLPEDSEASFDVAFGLAVPPVISDPAVTAQLPALPLLIATSHGAPGADNGALPMAEVVGPLVGVSDRLDDPPARFPYVFDRGSVVVLPAEVPTDVVFPAIVGAIGPTVDHPGQVIGGHRVARAPSAETVSAASQADLSEGGRDLARDLTDANPSIALPASAVFGPPPLAADPAPAPAVHGAVSKGREVGREGVNEAPPVAIPLTAPVLPEHPAAAIAASPPPPLPGPGGTPAEGHAAPPVRSDPGGLAAEAGPPASFPAAGGRPLAPILPPGASELRLRALSFEQVPTESVSAGPPVRSLPDSAVTVPVVLPPPAAGLPVVAVPHTPELVERFPILAPQLTPGILASVHGDAPAVDPAAPSDLTFAGHTGGVLRHEEDRALAIPTPMVAEEPRNTPSTAVGTATPPNPVLLPVPATSLTAEERSALRPGTTETTPPPVPTAPPTVLWPAAPKHLLADERTSYQVADRVEGPKAAVTADTVPVVRLAAAVVRPEVPTADLSMMVPAAAPAPEASPLFSDPVSEGLGLLALSPSRTEASPAGPGSAAPGPASAAPVLQQVTGALSGSPAPVTELRLSPEELGSVRIEVTTEGDKVAMVVAAERQDTLDLLRRNADRLMADLRDAGFARLDLSFGAWSGPSGEERPSDIPSAALSVDEMSESTAALATTGSATSRAATAAGLYLRI